MSEASNACRPPWAGMSADYRAAVARAEALVPALRERAVKTEKLRRLPEETERDLHETGLFRVLQPRRVGGAELDYVALIDIGDILARGDASVGWNFANLASHHWMLAMWDKAAQDRIWDENADALIASSFVFPAGRARKAPGGYMLSGRWPFSSGVDPSGWNMLAGIVVGEGGNAPDYRVFLVPKDDYRIMDSWDALGLKGTGSHDVEIAGAFVPEHMTVAASEIAGGPTPGSAVNPKFACRCESLRPEALDDLPEPRAKAGHRPVHLRLDRDVAAIALLEEDDLCGAREDFRPARAHRARAGAAQLRLFRSRCREHRRNSPRRRSGARYRPSRRRRGPAT